MGNCFRGQSSMQWGGENWGSPVSDKHFPIGNMHGQDNNIGRKAEKVDSEKTRCFDSDASTAAAGATEVKIKITKKQLEELLGRGDVKELSVEQVLMKLMDASFKFEKHERPWRPALQSIPE